MAGGEEPVRPRPARLLGGLAGGVRILRRVFGKGANRRIAYRTNNDVKLLIYRFCNKINK